LKRAAGKTGGAFFVFMPLAIFHASEKIGG